MGVTTPGIGGGGITADDLAEATNPYQVRARSTTPWTTTTTVQPVIFNVTADNEGQYNPTTGVYTCPADGVYLVCSAVHVTPTDPAQTARLSLIWNGTTALMQGPVAIAAGTLLCASFAMSILTVAGATLAIGHSASTAGLQAAQNSNSWVSFTRLGP